MKIGKNIEIRFAANFQFVLVLILCVLMGWWYLLAFVVGSIAVGLIMVWIQIKFHLDEKWRHAPGFIYNKKVGKYFPVIEAEGVESHSRKKLAVLDTIPCNNPDEAICNAKVIATTMNENFHAKTKADY